ncbi:hypothetical protein FOCC_FOCC008793 [Frankliniella occidentalis]|nr:hypothetical protein FOCC_FOCC008793 [Frankliniella occidentalis]
MCNNLPEKKLAFTPRNLLDQCPNLSLVIDLTNTMRYYDKRTFQEKSVLYEKIFCPGHVIPPKDIVRKFFQVVDAYLEEHKDEDGLIGVHCTHGVNRTGYFICKYMIERLGMPPETAINDFNTARGHNIERENYIQDLMHPRAEAASGRPRSRDRGRRADKRRRPAGDDGGGQDAEGEAKRSRSGGGDRDQGRRAKNRLQLATDRRDAKTKLQHDERRRQRREQGWRPHSPLDRPPHGPPYGPPHGPPGGPPYGPPHGPPGGPPYGPPHGPPHGPPYGPPHGPPHGPPPGVPPFGPPHGAHHGLPYGPPRGPPFGPPRGLPRGHPPGQPGRSYGPPPGPGFQRARRDALAAASGRPGSRGRPHSRDGARPHDRIGGYGGPSTSDRGPGPLDD